MLIMAYYHLRTFVNEIGFHRIALPPPHLMSDQSRYHTWCSSITRSEVLISGLNAANDYLERYLSLPTEVVFSSSFADHGKLVYNVLILKLFATWAKDDDSQLDAAHIQNSANMAFYMEALVRKFENMNKIGRDHGLLEDYTLVLAQLFRTYEGRARGGVARHSSGSSYPEMSVMQILPLPSFHDTQPSNSSAVLQPQDDPEEQWADMLVRWSPTVNPQDLSTEALFK